MNAEAKSETMTTFEGNALEGVARSYGFNICAAGVSEGARGVFLFLQILPSLGAAARVMVYWCSFAEFKSAMCDPDRVTNPTALNYMVGNDGDPGGFECLLTLAKHHGCVNFLRQGTTLEDAARAYNLTII